MVIIKAIYRAAGHRESMLIHAPLRHVRNARPWLEAHYPQVNFIFGECNAWLAS